MKTTLMVIAPAVFRDEEYDVPKRLLESRGVAVVTASTHRGECTGKLGMVARADLTLDEAAARTWDAVAFIGGGGATVYFTNEQAHALARATFESGGVVAAICIAPSILAHAGLLDGVRATAFDSERETLAQHGAVWSVAPVVRDGSVVTANGPDAAAEFGTTIASLL
jgi:protease I